MRKVKSKNTTPEVQLRKLLRKLLWGMGYRGYRIHYSELPGCPDVAFTKWKKAIFVHGCFWHGHDCRAGKNRPKSNQDYWEPKLLRNQERDRRRQQEIRALGWSVLVVWECELKKIEEVESRLRSFLCVQSI